VEGVWTRLDAVSGGVQVLELGDPDPAHPSRSLFCIRPSYG